MAPHEAIEVAPSGLNGHAVRDGVAVLTVRE
jgi:hypothetical protein